MSTPSNNYPKRLSEYALGVAGGADTLTQTLANSRRVLSILSPILQSVCRGPDWTDISHVRVTDKKIVLFVPNALQKTKLRQVLPRLEAALQEKGFVLALNIVVRPTVKPLDVGVVPSTSPARTGSPMGAECLEKGAKTIRDTALRNALMSLAKTLRQTS